MATDLYKEVIFVPFMARFMVFAKRIEPLVAKLRVFCMTDDSEEKTLENQESFVEIAKSRNVEVFENKPLYVEFSGNLVPITKSGDQLKIVFRAFRENRLPFTVRVKDQHTDLIGRCMFMREPKMMKGDPPQQPLCSLNVLLPDNIATETCVDTIRSYRSIWDSYASGDFQILEIANLLGVEWPKLAYELGISRSDIENIKNQYPNSSSTQVQVMIKQWMNQTENKYQGIYTVTRDLQRVKLSTRTRPEKNVYNPKPDPNPKKIFFKPKPDPNPKKNFFQSKTRPEPEKNLSHNLSASNFTFPTVIHNRGKVLELAQKISKISRCFVLWEP